LRPRPRSFRGRAIYRGREGLSEGGRPGPRGRAQGDVLLSRVARGAAPGRRRAGRAGDGPGDQGRRPGPSGAEAAPSAPPAAGETGADATVAYAVGLVAAGRTAPAIETLNALARPSDRYVVSEVDYWQGRAREADDPGRALTEYLQVLRSPVPTHFAYFARRRL